MIKCVPTANAFVLNDVPVPIVPLTLLVHTRDAPLNAPSSGSVPEPENVTAVPTCADELLDGELMAADGAWLAEMLMVRVDTLVAPLASFAVSVIRCAPTVSEFDVNEVPVPMDPLRLLVQTNDAPLSTPSSGSDAEPTKLRDVPCTTDVPPAGEEMFTLGS